MRQYVIFVISALLFANSIHAQFSISGNSGPIYDYKEEVGSGTTLNHIFVLNNLSGALLVFESADNNLPFFKYSTSVTSKTPIPDSEINKTNLGSTTRYEISNLENDRGYIAGLGSDIVWIVDYSKYTETLNALNIREGESSECTQVDLILNRTSQPITYYDDNGAKEIRRKYTISYNNIEWNSQQAEYIHKDENETLVYSEPFRVSAPLIHTSFEIYGDQFAELFNIPQSISSEEYQTKRVEMHLTTEVIKEGGTTAGDSASVQDKYNAPVEMNFYSNTNRDVVQSYIWKVYHNVDPSSNPDGYLVSYTDEDISYTFTQAGNYIVTLDISSAGGGCPINDQTSFNVSESFIDFPNFLSPGTTSEGVTNIFKASYRSIIRFKCTIFNRWGNKIYEWTDIREGWDGTYKGKTVSPGVYFYVVDAEGSDGEKYKKGADINVLHGRNNTLQ